MHIQHAIENRRSIHEFKPDHVAPSKLSDIFTSAAWAPTHRMKEPWNIIMFQNEGIEDYAELVLESYEREGFFEAYNNEKSNKMKAGIHRFMTSIPHHALIYMERDSNKHKFEEDYAAVCAFIQNIQLLSWEKGVGVLWTTSPYLHDPLFVEGVGLQSDLHKLVGVLQMGYPVRIPHAKKRTPIENKYTLIQKKFKKS